MATMLLMTKGAGGDLFPMLRIGDELLARGHRVILFSHCRYAETAERAGFGFVAIDSPDEFERMTRDMPRLDSPQGIATLYRTHVLPRVPGECDLIAAHAREGAVLVTNHNMNVTAQCAAEKLALPLVSVLLAPSNSIVTNLPIFEALFKVLAFDVNRIREDLGLLPVHDWAGWLQSIPQSIACWPAWFAAPESGWPVNVSPVGFLLKAGDVPGEFPPQLLEFLRLGAPPVLITHGTTPAPPGFFESAVQACGQLGVRGVLLTSHEALVPGDLPDQVLWVKYVPSLRRLMRRVRLIVHHGGIGILGQALAAGIPHLVLPLGFDRPDNALRLKRLGVGDFVLSSQWQPEPVAQALGALLDDAAVRARCVEVAGRMASAETDAAVAACDAIERFVALWPDVEGLRNSAGTPAWAAETGPSSAPAAPPERLTPEKRALLALRLKRRQALGTDRGGD